MNKTEFMRLGINAEFSREADHERVGTMSVENARTVIINSLILQLHNLTDTWLYEFM